MKRRKHFPHSLGLSTPLNAFLSEVGIEVFQSIKRELRWSNDSALSSCILVPTNSSKKSEKKESWYSSAEWGLLFAIPTALLWLSRKIFGFEIRVRDCFFPVLNESLNYFNQGLTHKAFQLLASLRVGKHPLLSCPMPLCFRAFVSRFHPACSRWFFLT